VAYQFEWDPAKAITNLRKHGVSFDEAMTVFDDSRRIHSLDPDHSIHEQRYLLLGMSNQQRVLAVSYTERLPRIRIISARPGDRDERGKHAKG